MGQMLAYSIVGGLLMLSMLLGYRMFLAGANQPRFNRGILLTIYAVAFALPALISPARLIWAAAPHDDAVFFAGRAMAEPGGGAPELWGTVLIWVFMAGMAAVAVMTAVTWWRLARLIRSGEKTVAGGYTFVLTDSERFAPFSWMRYIVISRADYAGHRQAIATHEIEHIARRHWIDLLVAQIVCAVNWFNPAAWLMRRELMLVHEYQADMAVIASGHDARDYQMLLIRKAVGARFPSLANSLNHSKLKKRITMMQKDKRGAGRKLVSLALVPMLAIALGVASVPSVRAAIATIGGSGVSIGKSSENPAQNEAGGIFYKGTVIQRVGKETSVTVGGGNFGDRMTVSGGTLTVDGRTYAATALQCSMTDGNAEVTATFPYAGELTGAVMTLDVNGQEVPLIIGDYADQSAAQPDRFASLAGMTIYLNGEKISADELRQLPSDRIASMGIDARKNQVHIHLK